MTEIPDSRVWVLGRKVGGVGKSISWKNNNLQSFADCDVLIVDTTTLNEQLISSLNRDYVGKLFEEINKRFKTGLMIVCISSESFDGHIPSGSPRGGSYIVSNYFWSPAGCVVKKIPKGKTLKKLFPKKFLFEDYVDSISEWELALQGVPILKEDYSTTYGSKMYQKNLLATNSNDLLGGEFHLSSDESGSFIILPPLSTPDESIQKILEILGIEKETAPPSWIENIQIPSAKELEDKISSINKEIEEKQTEKQQISNEVNERNSFRKLVYETDKPLERICEKALKLIGLKNVHQGEPGKDDLLFDFTSNSDYSICSIDAKGLEGNLKIKDLRQLTHWVDDQLEKGTKSKGVILANTFRLDDLATSRTQRCQLERENLEFAIKREFCIFPTHILLDLCLWILEGNKPDLHKIEKAIANTNGFIELKDLI